MLHKGVALGLQGIWPGRPGRLWGQGRAQAVAEVLHLTLTGQEDQNAAWRQLPVYLAHLHPIMALAIVTIERSNKNLFFVLLTSQEDQDAAWRGLPVILAHLHPIVSLAIVTIERSNQNLLFVVLTSTAPGGNGLCMLHTSIPTDTMIEYSCHCPGEGLLKHPSNMQLQDQTHDV